MTALCFKSLGDKPAEAVQYHVAAEAAACVRDLGVGVLDLLRRVRDDGASRDWIP